MERDTASQPAVVCKDLTLEGELPSLTQCLVLSEKKNLRQGKLTVYFYYIDFFQPEEADSSTNIPIFVTAVSTVLLKHWMVRNL